MRTPLTSYEQVRLQEYVIEHMIEEQETICAAINSCVYMHDFRDFMIEKDYKCAFRVLSYITEVYHNFEFMVQLINYFFPNVRATWSKYNIFEQKDNITELHKCSDYEYKCSAKLVNIIFD